MILPVALATLLLGCEGTSSTDTDTDEDVEPRVCDAVVEGRYHAPRGFGMPMDLDITFDAEACEFKANKWSFPDQPDQPMNHSDTMLGGIVDGTDVELYGTTERWSDCPGELLEEGTLIQGVCGGTETYELVLKDQ